MTDQQKRWLVIAGLVMAAILVVVLIVSLVVCIKNLTAQRIATEKQEVYLPVVAHQEPSIVFLPAIFKQAASTPISLSDIYKVGLIEDAVVNTDGDVYDVGTFINTEDESVILKARCIDQGWPSPEIGTLYRLDSEGLLSPVVNNEGNNLQRFIVLDE